MLNVLFAMERVKEMLMQISEYLDSESLDDDETITPGEEQCRCLAQNYGMACAICIITCWKAAKDAGNADHGYYDYFEKHCSDSSHKYRCMFVAARVYINPKNEEDKRRSAACDVLQNTYVSKKTLETAFWDWFIHAT